MNFPEKLRLQVDGYESKPGDPFGWFLLRDGSAFLSCLATDGRCDGLDMPVWEHVSVTVRNRKMVQLKRCPTWEEMVFVKNTFWPDDQTVIQIHPPLTDYVNINDYCLHLWRPVDVVIPLPPRGFV
jgi:hypothetical protein